MRIAMKTMEKRADNMPDSKSLNVLIVEDLPTDADLCQREIVKALGPCKFKRVETREEFLSALEVFKPGIIISDFKLPRFDGLSALKLAMKLAPDTPFIVVTGSQNEDTAVECMKAGAWDYIIKEHIKRLGVAVLSALEQKTMRLESKLANQALVESEERHRNLFETMAQGVVYQDASGKITAANPAAERIFGLSLSQMQGRTSMDPRWGAIHEDGTAFPGGEHPSMVALRTGKPVKGVVMGVYNLVDDTRKWIYINAIPQFRNGEAKPYRVYTTFADITERTETNEALKNSEKRYRSLFESMLNGYAYCRMIYKDGKPDDFIYLDVNQAFETQTGLKDVVGKKASEVIPGINKSDEKLMDIYGRVALTGKPESFEIYLSALQMWFSISVYSPEKDYFVSIFDVITERKKNEQLITEEAVRRRILLEQSSDGIFVLDINGKVYEANKRFAEILGYSVGEVSQFHAWDWDIQLSREEILDMLTSVDEEGDHFETLFRRKDGTLCPVELSTNGASVSGQKLIFCVCRDITERKRAEVESKKSLAALQQALNETVKVLSSASEVKDPYTAGHQQRVTQLAVAIATEMSLTQEQVSAIRVSGILHDIGKLSIPSEILSKPGKLNDAEYNLVKTHALTGYNILKNVKFPWPVADIVVQHHERLNGSGYPNGLKGEDMMLEAKILAVADVVEAMSSHRPYRAALGEGAALEEISKHKGVLYDGEVVKACYAVFYDNAFKFEEL
jgi:PAS domain S-box-containing protein/putative nucleotidyltransferase with HDIG domain